MLSAWGVLGAFGLPGEGRAVALDDGYQLVRGAPPPLHSGAKAVVSLSLLPRAGHALLEGGPVLIRLGGERVRPLRALLGKSDAVDPHAEVPRFELAFTALRPGPARLDATCTFYLCKAERCRPIETTVSWTLEVLP